MKIIEPGHVYELDLLDTIEPQKGAEGPIPAPVPVILRFVNREFGTRHDGTITQEVLRALIDRTAHCDACLRWPGNDQIIKHLRMALALHESRALVRKVEKDELAPEHVATSPKDGHFVLSEGKKP